MDIKYNMFSICWQPSNQYRVTAFVHEIENFTLLINSAKISNNADLNGETSLDVTGVCILEHKELENIPNNLTQFYPNMIALDLSGCGIKRISRFDLKNFVNLKEIRLCQMEIEVLPDNLFSDLVNLEVIELQRNKIKFIEKEAFAGLKNVKYIDLRENTKINAIYATTDYEIEEDLNVTRLIKLTELNGLIEVYFHATSGGNLTMVKDIPCLQGEILVDLNYEVNKKCPIKEEALKTNSTKFVSSISSSSDIKVNKIGNSLVFSIKDEPTGSKSNFNVKSDLEEHENNTTGSTFETIQDSSFERQNDSFNNDTSISRLSNTSKYLFLNNSLSYKNHPSSPTFDDYELISWVEIKPVDVPKQEEILLEESGRREAVNEVISASFNISGSDSKKFKESTKVISEFGKFKIKFGSSFNST